MLTNFNFSVHNLHSPAGTGEPQNMANRMVFDALVELEETDGKLSFTPKLAKRWETEDWKTIRLYLRDDVYFHNGDKFTAQDVVNTVRMASEAPGSASFDNWRYVAEAIAEEDYVVRLELNAPNVNIFLHLYMPMCGIVNARAIEADPEKGYYIGTGPYTVSDFSTNDYITFLRNDDYWDEMPITKTQTWRYVPEISSRTIRLQNGEADISMSLPEGDFPMFRADPNFTTIPVIRNNSTGILLNMNDPITGDKNFRLAVAYAVDREEITMIALGDMGIVPTDGSAWGRTTAFRNTSIPLIPHDPDKAKEYLAASVYNGEELEITTAGIEHVRASEVLQEQLARIGVKSRVNVMDQTSFIAHTNGQDSKGQIMFWENVLGPNPGSFRNIYAPGAAMNRAMYNNPEFTAMLDQAPTILDEAERSAVYMQAQETIAEDLPFIPVFFRIIEFAAKAGLGGMKISLTHTFYDCRMMFLVIDG